MTKTSGLVVWGASHYRTNRVLWMLEECGAPFDHRPVDIRKASQDELAEVRRMNPRAKIPVLQDGSLVLAESAAILTYLGDHYGGSQGLVPPPMTRERATYDVWMFFLMSEVDSQSLYIHRKHVGLKHLYGEAPVAVEVAREYFARQMRVIIDQLRDVEAAEEGSGETYLLGGTFMACDILLGTLLLWAGSIPGWLPKAGGGEGAGAMAQPFSEEDMALLDGYQRRLMGRPGFARAAKRGAFPSF